MEIEEMKSYLMNTITEVDEILKDNKKWLNYFNGYADNILKTKETKEQLSKSFRKYKPFTYHTIINDLEKYVNCLYVDVRYWGQNVAKIKVNQDKIVTISTKGYEERNKEYFGCEKKLDNATWSGKDAREFRNIFRKFDNEPEEYKKKVRQNIHNTNKEHGVQDLLFSEFVKASSKDKLLCGIQPVTFADYFLAMKTPLKASSEKIFLAAKDGAKGGGIDILARTSGGKLTVIEVKDENINREPLGKVLSQATAYAVSITYLLRNSISADKWYKIFGYKRPLTKTPLTIRVCSAMPLKKDGSCEKFKSFKLNYGNDILEYHWIYFKEQDGALLNIDSDLNKKQYDN